MRFFAFLCLQKVHVLHFFYRSKLFFRFFFVKFAYFFVYVNVFSFLAAVCPSDPPSFRLTVRSAGTNPRWLSIWPLSPKLHPFDKENPTALNGAHTALPSLGGVLGGMNSLGYLLWVNSLGYLRGVQEISKFR